MAVLTTAQVSGRWNRPGIPFSTKKVRRWCERGVFPHAFRMNDRWLIPETDVLLREGTNPEGAT